MTSSQWKYTVINYRNNQDNRANIFQQIKKYSSRLPERELYPFLLQHFIYRSEAILIYDKLQISSLSQFSNINCVIQECNHIIQISFVAV